MAVGKNTDFGQIREFLNDIKKEKTPMEMQINRLVFVCIFISGIVFVLTVIINYVNHGDMVFYDGIVEVILAGVTIAMVTIPEEIPVVLTFFFGYGSL